MITTIDITTEQRELVIEHLAELFRCPRTTRFTTLGGKHLSLADAKALARRTIQSATGAVTALELDGRPVGYIWRQPAGTSHDLQCLLDAYQGTVFQRIEVAKRGLRQHIATIGLMSGVVLQARVDARNAPVLRALTRVGFVHLATFPGAMPPKHGESSPRDMAILMLPDSAHRQIIADVLDIKQRGE